MNNLQCKFGGVNVTATWVTCPAVKVALSDREVRGK
jgi:hypothetical protein